MLIMIDYFLLLLTLTRLISITFHFIIILRKLDPSQIAVQRLSHFRVGCFYKDSVPFYLAGSIELRKRLKFKILSSSRDPFHAQRRKLKSCPYHLLM